jgi:hypothetical protein
MTRFLRWSLKAYRRLLMLYPEDLRRDFGAEILEAFEGDLSAACTANSIRGTIRVWRIALHETIRIGLPAWMENPALAVPAISAALAIMTQSPLLILTIRRATQLNLRPGDATPIDTLFALALGAALTALTTFVAVRRWKRASLISLGIERLGIERLGSDRLGLG